MTSFNKKNSTLPFQKYYKAYIVKKYPWPPAPFGRDGINGRPLNGHA